MKNTFHPVETSPGKLSIVATPIGNLEDITLRALRILKECDVIYAEDTRVIAKLLQRYEIQKPLQRLDAATEGKKVGEVLRRLEAGERVVYVSDAGTPGISDPGSRLVAAVRASSQNVVIEAIPGPSALAALVSIAGVDMTQFTFLGFLPHKKGRQTALRTIATMLDGAQGSMPVMLYESPHRILKLLSEIVEVLPECRVTIGRELTKMHEEVLQGTPQELIALLESDPNHQRGEFVVIIERVQ